MIVDDTFGQSIYRKYMRGELAYYVYKLETSEPPELADFVAGLTGLGNQFDKFVRHNYPELSGSARFYVQKVKTGSYIVEILPVLQPIIQHIDHFLILKEFAASWQAALKVYFDGFTDPSASRSDLSDFYDTVKAVAKDRNAKQKLELAVFEDGKRRIRTAFKFDTSEARVAQKTLENEFRKLTTVAAETHRRVVMFFEQMKKRPVALSQATGDRAVIEQLMAKPLTVSYQSELARDEIKRVLSASEFPWRIGFVVDVMIVTKGGKPVAYAITDFHESIEIDPDDDDDGATGV